MQNSSQDKIFTYFEVCVTALVNIPYWFPQSTCQAQLHLSLSHQSQLHPLFSSDPILIVPHQSSIVVLYTMFGSDCVYSVCVSC